MPENLSYLLQNGVQRRAYHQNFQSDYGFKLENHNVDNWLQRKKITFELSAPYFLK